MSLNKKVIACFGPLSNSQLKLRARNTLVLNEAIMNMMSCQQSKIVEARHRVAELYLNGTCLVRSIFFGRFQNIPFFLRHLWCALVK